MTASARAWTWAERIDRAPALWWPACLSAALLPTWAWMARRLADGSDDPLGLLAIAGLCWVVWRHRCRLRPAPRAAWLRAAIAGVLAATLLRPTWPPLLCAMLAVGGLGAALVAFLPRQVPGAPVFGLALLSLPWIASLQFYAGYPLRALTAEASRWLLAPWYAVERAGTALRVDGQLVIVDAPCSGVQLLWLGYFTACVAALHVARGNRTFLTRLPLVSCCVLTGNVVRNAVLVATEAAGSGLRGAAHDAAGLAVMLAVCGAIVAVMARPEGDRHAR